METLDELQRLESRKLANAYLRRFDRALAPLPAERAEARRLEIEAHIIDALDREPQAPPEAVATILERLGDPEDIGFSIARAELSRQAARGFRPASAFQALSLGLKQGVGGGLTVLVASVAYALAFILLLAGIAWLLAPARFGFFELENGTYLFGSLREGDVVAREIAGRVFAPILFVASVGFYWAGASWTAWRFGQRGAAYEKAA